MQMFRIDPELAGGARTHQERVHRPLLQVIFFLFFFVNSVVVFPFGSVCQSVFICNVVDPDNFALDPDPVFKIPDPA